MIIVEEIAEESIKFMNNNFGWKKMIKIIGRSIIRMDFAMNVDKNGENFRKWVTNKKLKKF